MTRARTKAMRRTPLQVLWKGVKVVSLANGRMLVIAAWTDGDRGLLTRLYAARHLERLIRAHLRGKR